MMTARSNQGLRATARLKMAARIVWAISTLRKLKEDRQGTKWEMDLKRDQFVHFTTSKRALEILESGKLLFNPPYQKFGIEEVAAVSIVWGYYQPKVQTTHIKAPDEGDIVAILFRTSTKPKIGYPEEVLWSQDVVLKQAQIIPASRAASMIQSAPLGNKVQGFGHWVIYR